MADASLTLEQRIANSQLPEVQKIYFNGFVTAVGGADIMCALELNSSAVATLNMSFTTAKTFARALGNVISQLEQQAGREIMTTNDVDKFMNLSVSETK